MTNEDLIDEKDRKRSRSPPQGDTASQQQQSMSRFQVPHVAVINVEGRRGALGAQVVSTDDFATKGWDAPADVRVGVRDAPGLDIESVQELVNSASAIVGYDVTSDSLQRMHIAETLGRINKTEAPTGVRGAEPDRDVDSRSSPRSRSLSPSRSPSARLGSDGAEPPIPSLADQAAVTPAGGSSTGVRGEGGRHPERKRSRSPRPVEESSDAETTVGGVGILVTSLITRAQRALRGESYEDVRILQSEFLRLLSRITEEALRARARKYMRRLYEFERSRGDAEATQPPDMGGDSSEAESMEPRLDDLGPESQLPESQPPERLGGMKDFEPESQLPGSQTESPGEDARGPDPPPPADSAAPRIVGRASERSDDALVVHDFLVHWPAHKRPKRKANTRWVELAEIERDADLRAAFESLPPQRRGDDPEGRGWVVQVDDVRDGQEGREYRVVWFTWMARLRLDLRREWRPYGRLVNPALADAFEASLRSEAGLEEEDDDDDDDLRVPASVLPQFLQETQMESQELRERQRTAQAPSSVRWDPSTGQPRLSIRASVRNHAALQPWSIDALLEYTLMRQFVLRSRVPPSDAALRPTDAELQQLGEDLFFLQEKSLTNKWRRARAQAQRRRKRQQPEEEEGEEEEGEEEEGEEEGEEGEEEEVDPDDLDADDEAAEEAWRKATIAQLRHDAVGRWTASRSAVDAELRRLETQTEALRRVRDAEAADAGVADAVVAAEAGNDELVELLQTWRSELRTGKWAAAFSRPRLKCPDIRDYLAPNRSTVTDNWLLLQRKAHAKASLVERTHGVMGSAYGLEWPFGPGIPTAMQVQGDHVVPVEQMTIALFLLETRDPRQFVPNIALCLDDQNQSKSDAPLGVFSPTSDAKQRGVYYPTGVSIAKRRMLAKKVASVNLMFPAISHRKTAKGVATLQRAAGVDFYTRAWQFGSFRELVRAPASAHERRLELLSLAVPQWQCCNPLVFDPGLLTPELETLLEQRLKGENPLLKLLDISLQDSVLFAPR